MKKYSTGLVNYAACAGVAFFGVAMLSLGAILPSLKELVPASISLPWIFSIGIITGTIIFGPVMDRYGYKWLLICSSLLLVAGLAGLAVTLNIWLLRLSIFCAGIGGGILNGETTVIVSDIYDDKKRAGRLSLLGAVYCLGSILWTFSCYLLPDYRVPLKWSAAVILLMIISFVFIRFPEPKVHEGEGMSFFKSLKLFKYELLTLASVLLFFESMLESASAIFSTSYFLSFPDGLKHAAAIFALSLLTAGMMAGRLVLPSSLKKTGNVKSAFIYLSVAFSGSVLLLLFPKSELSDYLSMIFIGFGMGVTSPVIFNYLGRVFKKYSGTAFSLVILVALFGQFIGNLLIGKLFTQSSITSGFFRFFPLILSLLIITVTAMIFIISKIADKTVEKTINCDL